MIPSLCRRETLVDAFAARHGEDGSDRVVVSVWSEGPDGDPELDHIEAAAPDDHPTRDDVSLAVTCLAVAARFDRPDRAGILRVFDGMVRHGELDQYVLEAERGMREDAAVNPGLVAFYLGLDGPDRFVTVSAWSGWDAIERATGGDVRQPFATRYSDRLIEFTVRHYEILPDLPRPSAELAVRIAS